MTTISVEVDIQDCLDEMDTDDLVEELRLRNKMPVNETRALANRLRSAFYRRDASAFEALLTAHLDPHEIKKVAAA